MATLTVSPVTRDSTTQTEVAADVAGDVFSPGRGGLTFVSITNGSGSPITVGFKMSTDNVSGLTRSVVVSAGAQVLWGPVIQDYIVNGEVSMTYSDVTSLTIGVWSV